MSLEQVQQGELVDEVYYQGIGAAKLLRESGMLEELVVWNHNKERVLLLDRFSGIGSAIATITMAGLDLKRWFVVEKDEAVAAAAGCLMHGKGEQEETP